MPPPVYAVPMGEENPRDLSALQSGDKAAWDKFVLRYSGIVFSAVLRRLNPAGRGDESEDVVQDVFVRLCRDNFRLLKTYDSNRARMTTWLTVVATSSAIDHLRRSKRRGEDLDSVPESLLSVEPKEPIRFKIPEGLLSERQALILEMLYQREMDPAEVAKVLDVNPQTVRSTHHKALVKLRAHFATDEAGTD